MSYTRRFRKHIAVPYRGYVEYSYVGSDGHMKTGRESYSGYAEDTVEVEVYVDTAPFDNSVEDCADHVKGLTGSVVATEAAQVASIAASSKQMGDAIVNGFFSTVKFEISTQIVELQKHVEALLMDIKDKQKRLLDMQRQMEKDYRRTASRYADIFNELNKELDNRVHALDQPVFQTANQIFDAENRYLGGDMINTVAIAGEENAILDAQISAALSKKHAVRALNDANVFLAKKQSTENTIMRCTIDECIDRKYYAPVCCISACDEHSVNSSTFYASEMLPQYLQGQMEKSRVIESIGRPNEEEQLNIDRFFSIILNESYTGTDGHDARVRNVISRLYSSNQN